MQIQPVCPSSKFANPIICMLGAFQVNILFLMSFIPLASPSFLPKDVNGRRDCPDDCSTWGSSIRDSAAYNDSAISGANVHTRRCGRNTASGDATAANVHTGTTCSRCSSRFRSRSGWHDCTTATRSTGVGGSWDWDGSGKCHATATTASRNCFCCSRCRPCERFGRIRRVRLASDRAADDKLWRGLAVSTRSVPLVLSAPEQPVVSDICVLATELSTPLLVGKCGF